MELVEAVALNSTYSDAVGGSIDFFLERWHFKVNARVWKKRMRNKK